MKYNAVLDVLLTDNVSLVEPVSAAEFKVYARIDGSIVNEDTNITNLVVASRKQVEAYLNRSLVARNVVAVLNNSLGSITLPYQDTIADTADIEVKDLLAGSLRIAGQ